MAPASSGIQVVIQGSSRVNDLTQIRDAVVQVEKTKGSHSAEAHFQHALLLACPVAPHMPAPGQFVPVCVLLAVRPASTATVPATCTCMSLHCNLHHKSMGLQACNTIDGMITVHT